MNDLLSKEFDGTGVRILMIEDTPWWNAADVCRVLGYHDGRKAIKEYCKSKGVSKRDTPTAGGTQSMTYIDEGNVLRLITKSTLPEAEKFESWVFDKVLPEIRKTGGYSISPQNYIEALEAHLIAEKKRALLEVENKVLEQDNKDLTAELTALKNKMVAIDPKAAAVYDLLINDGHISIIAAGRGLRIGGIKTMNKALRNAGIFKQFKNEPYQKYIDLGYFTLNTPGMKEEYHVTGPGMLFLNSFDLKSFIHRSLIKENASIKIESFSLFNPSDIIVIAEE